MTTMRPADVEATAGGPPFSSPCGHLDAEPQGVPAAASPRPWVEAAAPLYRREHRLDVRDETRDEPC